MYVKIGISRSILRNDIFPINIPLTALSTVLHNSSICTTSQNGKFYDFIQNQVLYQQNKDICEYAIDAVLNMLNM